jgi:WD40 repeat protein
LFRFNLSFRGATQLLVCHLLVCHLLICVLAFLTPALAVSEPVLGAGEIRLDGTLRAVDTLTGTLVLSVNSYSLPNGKTTALTPAKSKIVIVKAATLLQARGDKNQTVKLSDLKAGLGATVVGPDTGTGQEMQARSIIVDIAPLIPTPPVIAPPAITSPVVAPPVVVPPIEITLPKSVPIEQGPMRPEFQVQIGHLGAVRATAFSPDGSLLATGGFDRMIKLWDAKSGQLLRTLGPHKGGGVLVSGVSTLVFSHDGDFLFSGAGEADPWQDGGEIKMWQVDSGALLRTWKADAAGVAKIKLSPDGQVLASCGQQGTKVWELKTGRLLQLLPGQSDVYSMDFSPDGTLLITASIGGTVKFWDTATWMENRSFKADDGVRGIAVSPDGKMLATGEAGNAQPYVRLRHMATGNVRLSMPAGAWIQALVWSPDGTLVACGTGTDTYVWDTRTGDAKFVMRGVEKALSFSPDSQILSSANSRDVRLWDMRTDKLARLIEGGVGLNQVVYSPDGAYLVTPANDATIKIWDAKRGTLNRILETDAPTRCVSFSPEGKLLASGDSAGNVALWNIVTGELDFIIEKAHERGVFALAFAPDGRLATSAAGEDAVKLWDVKTHQLLTTLSGFHGTALSLAFSPDGQHLAIGSGDDSTGSEIQILNSYTRNALWRAKAPGSRSMRTVLWTGDGTGVWGAAYGENEGLKLFDAKTGAVKLQLKGHTRPLNTMAVSPDGSLVLMGGVNGLRLWDAATGKLLWASPLSAYIGVPNSVAFAPDGRSLASVGEDAQVRLWSLENLTSARQTVLLLPVPGSYVKGAFDETITMTPEGYYSATLNAEALLSVRLADKLYSAAQIKAQLNRPDYVLQAIGGQKLPPPDIATP